APLDAKGLVVRQEGSPGETAEVPYDDGPRRCARDPQRFLAGGGGVKPVKGLRAKGRVDARIGQPRRLGAPGADLDARVAGEACGGLGPHRRVRLDGDDVARAGVEQTIDAQSGTGAEVREGELGHGARRVYLCGDLDQGLGERRRVVGTVLRVVLRPIAETVERGDARTIR